MTTLFDDVRDGLRNGINMIVKKTDELTKLGKINIDILNIKREIEKNRGKYIQ